MKKKKYPFGIRKCIVCGKVNYAGLRMCTPCCKDYYGYSEPEPKEE